MRVHLLSLEKHLSDGRSFVCGETFTLADVGFMSTFARLDNGGWNFLWTDLPKVQEYWRKLRTRPSYQVAIEEQQLPIMKLAFARLRFWKSQHQWVTTALESSSPVSITPLLRSVLKRILMAAVIIFLCRRR